MPAAPNSIGNTAYPIRQSRMLACGPLAVGISADRAVLRHRAMLQRAGRASEQLACPPAQTPWEDA